MANLTGTHSVGYQMEKAGYKAYDPNAGIVGPTGIAQGTAAQIDQGPQNQMRAGQQDLISQLQAQANGQGPSVAQGQLVQGQNRGLAQSLAMAAANRGGSAPGLNAQMLSRNQGAMAGQNAADAANLRAEEILASRGQLGSALQGARGQDIGLAENQAGLSNQMNLLNTQQMNQGNQFNTSLASHQHDFNAGQLADENAMRMGQYNSNLAATRSSASQGINALGSIAAGIASGGTALIAQGAEEAAKKALASGQTNNLGGQTGVNPDYYASGGGGSSPTSFAKGGIVYHPTNAIVGDAGPGGTAGPEAIVPLKGQHYEEFMAHIMALHRRTLMLEALAHHVNGMPSGLGSAPGMATFGS